MPSVLVRVVVIYLALFINSVQANPCDFEAKIVDSYNVPERYSKLPTDLLDLLRKSFYSHTAENKYLDNSFWGSDPSDKCTWPQSLWEALDNVGPNGIFTIVSVYQRAKDALVLSTIGPIKVIWYGTSFGFNFEEIESADKMEQHITSIKGFCQDLDFIANKEHNGQTCWRQITKDSKGSGLHICFGNNLPPEIHVDYNQVAIGTLPLSKKCIYDPLAVKKHYNDLKGKPPETIFDKMLQERIELNKWLARIKQNSNCNGFGSYLMQQELEQMIGWLSDEKILATAAKGELGPSTGLKIMREVFVKKQNLGLLNFCGCGN